MMTNEQRILKIKQAKFLLDLKAEKDVRYREFVLRLMLATNNPQLYIENKIVEYSKGIFK